MVAIGFFCCKQSTVTDKAHVLYEMVKQEDGCVYVQDLQVIECFQAIVEFVSLVAEQPITFKSFNLLVLFDGEFSYSSTGG